MNKITLLHQVGISYYFMRKMHGQHNPQKWSWHTWTLIRDYSQKNWKNTIDNTIERKSPAVSPQFQTKMHDYFFRVQTFRRGRMIAYCNLLSNYASLAPEYSTWNSEWKCLRYSQNIFIECLRKSGKVSDRWLNFGSRMEPHIFWGQPWVLSMI